MFEHNLIFFNPSKSQGYGKYKEPETLSKKSSFLKPNKIPQVDKRFSLIIKSINSIVAKVNRPLTVFKLQKNVQIFKESNLIMKLPFFQNLKKYSFPKLKIFHI